MNQFSLCAHYSVPIEIGSHHTNGWFRSNLDIGFNKIKGLAIFNNTENLEARLAMVSKHMPVILIGTSLAVVIVYFIVSGFADQNQLRLWAGTLLALTGVRAIVWRMHFAQPPHPKSPVQQANQVFVLTTLSGLLWGLAGLLFFNESFPYYNLLLMLIIAAVTSIALVTTTGLRPLYIVFAIFAISPVSIYLVLQTKQEFLVMGASFLFYLIVNMATSENIEESITRTFRLQNENAMLIKELREQKEIAEQANLDKSKFLAAISHDLRQPMHAIGLFISGLRPYVKPVGHQVLDKAHHSLIALRSMFNGLLDLTRLDAGEVDIELAPLKLAPFIERVVEGHTGAAVEKGLQLNLQKMDVMVSTDALMLERVLGNLLANAIQYSQKGIIRVRCLPGADIVTIEVHDEGCGIPLSEQQNIFSEYHQLDNYERNRTKGLGLGLSIVRRICENLDIPIRVESKLGEGSVFSLDLPVAEEYVAELLKVETPMLGFRSQSVVVIDDEQAILDATGRLFGMWGYEVVLAESIDQAIKLIDEESFIPTVLVVDYRLRRETGMDAISRIRSKFDREIPSIILTGDTSPGIVEIKNSNKLIILHKPVAPAELRTAIQQLTIVKDE